MSMQKTSIPEDWRESIAAFRVYMQALGYSDDTIKSRTSQIRRFGATIGNSPTDVTTRDLVAALARCKSNAYKKNVKNAFSLFFKWYCHIEERRPDNPAEMLPNIRKPQPHPKPCPDESITEALKHATAIESCMILLGSECGLRRGEIAQVHSNDVIRDSDGRYSLIVHGKGDKQRTVPLPDDLAKTIKTANGYMFPGRRGGHVEVSYISRHVGRLLPDGYSTHKLRHRFATVAYAESHDMLGVSKALGHSSTETTMSYTALPDERLRELVDAATMTTVKPATVKRSITCGVAVSLQQGDTAAITLCPPSRTDDMKPKRRNDGRISYPYEGKHGKETAASSPEALRMQLMLTLEVAELRAQGGREFDISAEQFAERHSVRATGYARRSSVVRAAARRLNKVGVIDLVPDHHGRIRGVINLDTASLIGIAGMIATEYAAKVRR